jgi:hypothetical protein
LHHSPDGRSVIGRSRDENLDEIAVAKDVEAVEAGRSAQAEHGAGTGEIKRALVLAEAVERMVAEPVEPSSDADQQATASQPVQVAVADTSSE